MLPSSAEGAQETIGQGAPCHSDRPYPSGGHGGPTASRFPAKRAPMLG